MLFRSYLKISWRNLSKDKRFTLLNGIGLSGGLACVILCMLWVLDEVSFDKGFEGQNQLTQVMVNHPGEGSINTDNAMSATLGRDLQRAFPEVEDYVTTAPAEWFTEFNMSVPSGSGATLEKAVGAKGNFVGKIILMCFLSTYLWATLPRCSLILRVSCFLNHWLPHCLGVLKRP